MITARQMIALGPRIPALALGATSQLLESTVKFFDLPAHMVLESDMVDNSTNSFS